MLKCGHSHSSPANTQWDLWASVLVGSGLLYAGLGLPRCCVLLFLRCMEDGVWDWYRMLIFHD